MSGEQTKTMDSFDELLMADYVFIGPQNGRQADNWHLTAGCALSRHRSEVGVAAGA